MDKIPYRKYANQCSSSLPIEQYKERISDFFDKISEHREKWIDKNKYYYEEHYRYMKFLIPENLRVLEIGTQTGRLLNVLNPSYGVGINSSGKMIKYAKNNHKNLKFLEGDIEDQSFVETIQGQYDYIILCDSIGYLIDCQKTLKSLHKFCKHDTRLIISYYSWMWEPILKIAELFGQKMPQPELNWLSTDSIINIIELADFKFVKREWRQLIPKNFFGIGKFINKYIGTLPLIRRACLRNYIVARPSLDCKKLPSPSLSIVIPCKNEKGNVEKAVKRIPSICDKMEIIFVEGNSKDKTAEEIQRVIGAYPEKDIKMIQQDGSGKWNAVSQAFSIVKNDILMILDGDLTMPPEELPKFYEAISMGKGEFINGTRMIYPMENNAMRILNYWANSIFSLLFTWILNQRYTDTLCGTKVLSKSNYKKLVERCHEYSKIDPFGDFFLIFGAHKENLQTVEIPIRYRSRDYGETQISRFRHGLMLVRMVYFSYKNFKAF